ncbi:MAG: hypothetical protein GX374_07290 [Bacilli bacterium]|nr:hypothetical protein [Bacilli bacterium]
MGKVLNKWFITFVAIVVAAIGMIGNLIIEPNIIVILGLLTGVVIMFIINLLHNKFVRSKIDDDTYGGEDLF